MAITYYDDAISLKLKNWIPENSTLRVLNHEETKKFFELAAEDSSDKPVKLPFIALSRDTDIVLNSTIKQPKSFSGAKLTNYRRDQSNNLIIDDPSATAVINALPIKLNYQLDIYTKTAEEGNEYLRNFLFKLINNPTIYIEIPYNGANIKHIAYIRVLDTISDTSAINERVFSGQFHRWTIQMEIHDAFLFNIPYKKNWILGSVELATVEKSFETYTGDTVEEVYKFRKSD